MFPVTICIVTDDITKGTATTDKMGKMLITSFVTLTMQLKFEKLN